MKEESLSLIHKAKEGDREALSFFVEENLGLVHSCVRRFRGRGVEEDDLFQLGSLGLIKAVKRFDATLGLEFSTYAVPVILGEIRRFFRDDGWIKVSRSVKESARHIRACEEALFLKMGRTPTLSEVADEAGLSEEETVIALSATTPGRSLDECVHEGGSTPVLLKDVIRGEGDEEEKSLERVMISSALKCLSEKEKRLLFYRYYRGKTQGETANLLSTNQVGVSRMEKRVLQKMRETIGKENL